MKKWLQGLLTLTAAGCLLAGGAVLAACEPPEHEHTLETDWTVVSAASCEENGLRVRHCTVEGCTYRLEEDIPAVGHDYDAGTVTKAPTCEEKGERTRVCRRCQNKKVVDESPLNHDWDAGVVTAEADCRKTGTLHLTCLRAGCGKTDDREIPLQPHDMQETAREEAKCTTNGYITYTCKVCGTTEKETLEKLGHRWKLGTLDQEPTCTQPGKRDRTCTVCGTTENETLKELGHNFEGDYTIDRLPSFTRTGWKSYHCTRCDETTGGVEIPMLEANTPIQYEFRILRNNGTPVTGTNLSIAVFDGETPVSPAGMTSGAGVFRGMLAPKTYTVKVSGLPAGFTAKEEYTVTAEYPYCDIWVTASPIKEPPTRSTHYTVGSVIHDYTFTGSMTYDGKSYTISDILKTKKVLVLNFWATWCGPCESEFPALGAVYRQYRDSIEVLAIDESARDTLQTVRSYVQSHGLAFPTIFELTQNLQGKFGVSGIPTTVVIDSEGVVCAIHSGASSQAQFTALISPYLADNYWKNPEKASSVALESAGPEAILPTKRSF